MKLMLCAQCHLVGEPVRQTRGSLVLEMLLWLLFLPVGILYSVWRLTTRGPACRACGSRALVTPRPHS